MDNILQMHDIDKYYDTVKAVDGAFLEVQKGEIHTISTSYEAKEAEII